MLTRVVELIDVWFLMYLVVSVLEIDLEQFRDFFLKFTFVVSDLFEVPMFYK